VPVLRGWIVVGGAFLVLFVAYGAQYSFGVFFAALLEEFHWSRASLAGAFSLYAVLYCFFGFQSRAICCAFASWAGVSLLPM